MRLWSDWPDNNNGPYQGLKWIWRRCFVRRRLPQRQELGDWLYRSSTRTLPSPLAGTRPTKSIDGGYDTSWNTGSHKWCP